MELGKFTKRFMCYFIVIIVFLSSIFSFSIPVYADVNDVLSWFVDCTMKLAADYGIVFNTVSGDIDGALEDFYITHYLDTKTYREYIEEHFEVDSNGNCVMDAELVQMIKDFLNSQVESGQAEQEVKYNLLQVDSIEQNDSLYGITTGLIDGAGYSTSIDESTYTFSYSAQGFMDYKKSVFYSNSDIKGMGFYTCYPYYWNNNGLYNITDGASMSGFGYLCELKSAGYDSLYIVGSFNADTNAYSFSFYSYVPESDLLVTLSRQYVYAVQLNLSRNGETLVCSTPSKKFYEENQYFYSRWRSGNSAGNLFGYSDCFTLDLDSGIYYIPALRADTAGLYKVFSSADDVLKYIHNGGSNVVYSNNYSSVTINNNGDIIYNYPSDNPGGSGGGSSDSAGILGWLQEIDSHLEKIISQLRFNNFLTLVDTLANVMDTVKDYFDEALEDTAAVVSLSEELSNKFPLSLPADILAILTVLEAPPQAPVFIVPFKADFGGPTGIKIDESWVLDFTMFDDAIDILKYWLSIIWIWGLVLITPKFIDMINNVSGGGKN